MSLYFRQNTQKECRWQNKSRRTDGQTVQAIVKLTALAATDNNKGRMQNIAPTKIRQYRFEKRIVTCALKPGSHKESH
jgi:hypothetical protein